MCRIYICEIKLLEHLKELFLKYFITSFIPFLKLIEFIFNHSYYHVSSTWFM